MNSPKQQLSELIHLVQHFLHQDDNGKEKTVSMESYDFFKSLIGSIPLPESTPNEVIHTAPLRSSPTKEASLSTSPPKQNELPINSPAATTPKQPPPTSSRAKSAVEPSEVPQQAIEGFQLEKLKDLPPLDFQEYATLLKTQAPNFSIKDSIPDDALAKSIKEKWKTHAEMPAVVLLSFNESGEALELLKNIAQAVTERLAPARIFSAIRIDNEKKWERLLDSPELRLILADPESIKKLPELMKFYQEGEDESYSKIKEAAFIPINVALQINNNQEKRLLWQSISKALAH